MIVGNMTERPACRDASLWRGYRAGTIPLRRHEWQCILNNNNQQQQQKTLNMRSNNV